MKKINSYLTIFVLLAALLPAALPVSSVKAQDDNLTEIFQPDGDSGYDSYMADLAENANYSTEETMQVGHTTADGAMRGLITWDFSTLPADAEVVNATLSIWIAEDLAANASTLQVFVVTRNWSEASVTWVSYDPYYDWETKGAQGDADRLSYTSGTAALAADLTPGTRIDIVLQPNAISQMIRENYFGVILRTQNENEDAYTFYTSDYETDPDLRPMLTIDYDPSPAVVDPGWFCVDGTHALGPETCLPQINPEVPHSPFKHHDYKAVANSYGGPWMGNNALIGARMNCTPYPLCKNDFPVYYRVEYYYEWQAWNVISSSYGTTTLMIIGADAAAQETVSCGGGVSQGTCFGVLQGVIDPSAIPTSSQTMDFGLFMQFTVPAEYPVSFSNGRWRIYLSLTPYTEQCSDIYMVPTVDTYNIDPTIETPQGMVGDETPVDNQGYPTVIGQIYMVRVQGGPWNDSADDRFDTAVSTDGTTYLPFRQFASGENADVLCIEVDPLNKDWLTIYFTATTETFYIRVNDTAGVTPTSAFLDNTMDTETPMQYVIGLAFLLEPIDCSAQFVEEETLGSLTLDATSEEQAVNDENTAIIPNEWYGIEVASGTWTDDPSSEERIDMEFKFDAGGMRVQDWQVLAEGSHLVYCEATGRNIIYVQALASEGQIMSLRVNDQDNPKDWSDNGGSLHINVYHETFVRAPHGCELSYNLGDFISHDVVPANATNGKIFGFSLMVAGELMTGSLTPGAIYVLDTTDGPWWQTYTGGGYNENQYYYDVKVKTLLGEWSTLENWTESLCVVNLDGQGHQRVYFQVPNEGNLEYYIKVGGASPVGRGEMGWNLYKGYDNGETGTNCSSFTYDPNEVYGGDYVYSALENGQDITMLESDQYFAIEVLADAEAADPPDYRKSGWWENSSSEEEKDTLQITRSGTDWSTPETSPDVLCYYTLPSGNLIFFIKTSNGVLENWAMRADSESFTDNIGDETYKLYHASGEGINPWVSCLQDYTAYLPPLNSFEWIPVKQEEGNRLLPMETSPEVIDTNGDGLIWWENLWLMPDHIYEVDTLSGDWDDGEGSGHDGKAAQLSSDDGLTWYSFDTHPDVICFHQDANPERYWKAIFEVTDGQKWRVRVADDNGQFTDNGGSLAYELFLINEFPTCTFDCEGNPPGNGGGEVFDVCILALVKPAPLTLSEISNLGNYLGDWVQYIQRSILAYFAWCQRHTDIVKADIDQLKTKEPLGTVEEFGTIATNIEADIQSYDWDNGGTGGMSGAPVDTSIFDFGNEDGVGPNSVDGINAMFEQYIMPSSGRKFDAWDGGDVVDLTQQTGLPESYTNCNSVFVDYLPSRLRTGVCFATAYWHETGASFWIQILLDIGSIFLMFNMIKRAMQSLIYMMTGVRPWTKDGAIKIIETVRDGGNVVQPIDDWRSSSGYRRR
jgi:hypothetical protein